MHPISDSFINRQRLPNAISITAVLVFAVFALAVPVMAHSPSDMTIRYDPNTAKIYVTITHVVDDPQSHYLGKVQVKLNGLVISDPPYKSQPTKDTFTLTYDVNANPGDLVWITATCVRGGTLEKRYDMPELVRTTIQSHTRLPADLPPATGTQTQAPPAVPPATKAPLGLLPLLVAAAVIITRKK